MDKILLNAWPREEIGKAAVKRLRKDGFTPAILYGPKEKGAKPLKFSSSELKRIFTKIEKENVIIDLSIKKDGRKDERVSAIFKDIQWDTVSGKSLHIDLYEVVKGQKIYVHVPIHLVGKPVGVESGGIIQCDLRELEIECLPKYLPSSIDIDVSSLAIGDSLHVGDVKVGENIKILDNPEATILSIIPPVKEEVVAKTAEEVEEEIAESFEVKESEGIKT